MNFSLTDFAYKDALWPVENESVTTLVRHSPSNTFSFSRIQSAKDAGR